MLQFILMTLDERLDDDVVVFAKPHYYDTRKINFKSFKHVKQFPSDLETYEVLSMADLLVTDYSSVMFDFLNTNKEIVLFPYDQVEYFETRGAYVSLDELPFDRTIDVYDLCERINKTTKSESTASRYPEARKTYCPYDCDDAAKKLCD